MKCRMSLFLIHRNPIMGWLVRKDRLLPIIVLYLLKYHLKVHKKGNRDKRTKETKSWLISYKKGDSKVLKLII